MPPEDEVPTGAATAAPPEDSTTATIPPLAPPAPVPEGPDDPPAEKKQEPPVHPIKKWFDVSRIHGLQAKTLAWGLNQLHPSQLLDYAKAAPQAIARAGANLVHGAEELLTPLNPWMPKDLARERFDKANEWIDRSLPAPQSTEAQILGGFIQAAPVVAAAASAGAPWYLLGAAVDMLSFDAKQPGLQSLVGLLPDGKIKSALEYATSPLALNKDDSEIEAMLRRSAEGLLVGGALEATIFAVGAMRAGLRAGKTPAQVVGELQARVATDAPQAVEVKGFAGAEATPPGAPPTPPPAASAVTKEVDPLEGLDVVYHPPEPLAKTVENADGTFSPNITATRELSHDTPKDVVLKAPVSEAEKMGRPSSNRVAFDNALSEFLPSGEKMWQGTTTHVSVRGIGPNAIMIDAIRAWEPGSGEGKQILSKILQLADEHDITVTLNASPFDFGNGSPATMSQGQLENLYRRYGFERTSWRDHNMVRRPGETAAAYSDAARPSAAINEGAPKYASRASADAASTSVDLNLSVAQREAEAASLAGTPEQVQIHRDIVQKLRDAPSLEEAYQVIEGTHLNHLMYSTGDEFLAHLTALSKQFDEELTAAHGFTTVDKIIAKANRIMAQMTLEEATAATAAFARESAGKAYTFIVAHAAHVELGEQLVKYSRMLDLNPADVITQDLARRQLATWLFQTEALVGMKADAGRNLMILGHLDNPRIGEQGFMSADVKAAKDLEAAAIRAQKKAEADLAKATSAAEKKAAKAAKKAADKAAKEAEAARVKAETPPKAPKAPKERAPLTPEERLKRQQDKISRSRAEFDAAVEKMTPEELQTTLRMFQLSEGNPRSATGVLEGVKQATNRAVLEDGRFAKFGTELNPEGKGVPGAAAGEPGGVIPVASFRNASRFVHTMASAMLNAMVSGFRTMATVPVSGFILHEWEGLALTLTGVRHLSPTEIREGVAHMAGYFRYLRENGLAAKDRFLMGTSKLEPHAQTYRFASNIGQNFETTLGAASRLLATGDEWTFAAAYRAEVHAASVRASYEAGMTDTRLILERAAADVKASVDPLTGVALNSKAAADARVATLSGPLGSKTFGGMLSRLVNTVPGGAYMVKFLKTDINIFRYVNKSTPGISLFYQDIRETLRKGGPEAAVLRTKWMMTTAVGAAAWTHYMEGNITGDGPSDPDMRSLWLADNQPNSIRVGPGHPWHKITRFEPVASYLNLTANYHDIYAQLEYDNPDMPLTGMAAMSASMMKLLTNRGWLQDFSNLSDFLANPTVDGLEKVMKSGASAPAFVSQLNDDVYYREARDYMEGLRASAPWLSHDKIPKMYSALGEPIMRIPSAQNGKATVGERYNVGVALSKERPYSAHYVEQTLLDSHIGIPKMSRRFEGLSLTDEKYRGLNGKLPFEEMQELISKGFTDQNGNKHPGLRTALTELLHSEKYKNASEGKGGSRQQLVMNMVTEYREAARGMVMFSGQYPRLVQEYRVKLKSKDVAKTEGRSAAMRFLHQFLPD